MRVENGRIIRQSDGSGDFLTRRFEQVGDSHLEIDWSQNTELCTWLLTFTKPIDQPIPSFALNLLAG
jgi:hypothetical protein